MAMKVTTLGILKVCSDVVVVVVVVVSISPKIVSRGLYSAGRLIPHSFYLRSCSYAFLFLFLVCRLRKICRQI